MVTTIRSYNFDTLRAKKFWQEGIKKMGRLAVKKLNHFQLAVSCEQVLVIAYYWAPGPRYQRIGTIVSSPARTYEVWNNTCPRKACKASKTDN